MELKLILPYRDAEYMKTLKVSRLPGYLTVTMVRFQFKQKDAINAKILKDVKFPMMLDTFDLCTSELQEKLVSMRTKFKDYEDFIGNVELIHFITVVYPRKSFYYHKKRVNDKFYLPQKIMTRNSRNCVYISVHNSFHIDEIFFRAENVKIRYYWS